MPHILSAMCSSFGRDCKTQVVLLDRGSPWTKTAYAETRTSSICKPIAEFVESECLTTSETIETITFLGSSNTSV